MVMAVSSTRGDVTTERSEGVPGRLATIVVGVDGSPSAARALDWAAALVEPGGTIVAVHAVPAGEGMLLDSTPFGEPAWRRTIRRKVARQWCGDLRRRGVAFKVQIVERGVAAAILSVAEECDADLIVVGARRHRHRMIHHQGTLATHLDHRAKAPVLCVPVDA